MMRHRTLLSSGYCGTINIHFDLRHASRSRIMHSTLRRWHNVSRANYSATSHVPSKPTKAFPKNDVKHDRLFYHTCYFLLQSIYPHVIQHLNVILISSRCIRSRRRRRESNADALRVDPLIRRVDRVRTAALRPRTRDETLRKALGRLAFERENADVVFFGWRRISEPLRDGTRG